MKGQGHIWDDKLDIMITHHCMMFDENIQIRYFLWDRAILTHDFWQ